MQYTYVETPIGNILVAGRNEGVELISFPKGKGAIHPKKDWIARERDFVQAKAELSEYFTEGRKEFSFNIHPAGTEFQMAVWEGLRSIPYGKTISYGELARRIGRPAAVRAVGAANGANHLPLVLPCHRVIGADGSLTGFGGGLDVKRALLRLEGAVRDEETQGDMFCNPTA